MFFSRARLSSYEPSKDPDVARDERVHEEHASRRGVSHRFRNDGTARSRNGPKIFQRPSLLLSSAVIVAPVIVFSVSFPPLAVVPFLGISFLFVALLIVRTRTKRVSVSQMCENCRCTNGDRIFAFVTERHFFSCYRIAGIRILITGRAFRARITR